MYMSSLPVLYTNLLKYVVLSFQEQQDLLDGAQNYINMELDGDGAWEDDNNEDVVLSVPPPREEGFSSAMPEAKPCFSKFSWIP